MDFTVPDLILLLVALALAITFHEFMHGYAAHRLGDDTAALSGRLSLNPLAHVDPFATVLLPILLFMLGLPIFAAAKPVPFDPARVKYGEWGAALVAAAGPLTNLGLAIVSALWLSYLPVAELTANFLVAFITINVGLFVFNMIPFPPLDGSRVLYAVAPDALRAVMRQIESFGLAGIAIFIFVLFPFIQPIFGTIIGNLLSLLIP